MAVMNFRARVRDNRTIEIPEEAQDLGLEPGDEVTISVAVRDSRVHVPIASDEQQLSIMDQIAARHKVRRITDSSSTERLLDEARSGAAYGYDLMA